MEGRRQIRIDPAAHGFRIGQPVSQAGQDLRLAKLPVLNVLGDEFQWSVDDRAVTRIDALRSESREPVQGVKILTQTAAPSAWDHHGRAADEHVAGEEIGGERVPEAHVIRRVAGSVDHHEIDRTGPNRLAIFEW